MLVKIGPYTKDSKRKIQVRIDPHDTISMDYTLSLIILPMLKQLKKVKRFAPDIDECDLPKKLRSVKKQKKNYINVDKYELKRWDYILSEMIWAFTQVSTDWHNIAWKKKSRKEAVLYFNRVDNGIRLFGKYYLRLWE
jgi:hypothetical protein